VEVVGMKKGSFLFLSVVIAILLSLLLTGCVPSGGKPAAYSNPYLPDKSSLYDLIEVSVNPALMTSESANSLLNSVNALLAKDHAKDVTSSLLSILVSCREDARYEVFPGDPDEQTEYKVIFSDAWKANPSREETNPFLDFGITENSEVYLYSGEIKLIDGPNGNAATTITTTINSTESSVTITRISSYISSLPLENHVYSNVLKVQLIFSGHENYQEYSSVEISYYFDKAHGLVKFDMYVNTEKEKIPLMDVSLVQSNVGKYEIGPSPAKNLEPDNTSIPRENVPFTWDSTETAVTYDLMLFSSGGTATVIPDLTSKSYTMNSLAKDIYQWTIVTRNSNNDLSTIAKLAIFFTY
jgi:hypothetical protein